MWAQQICPIEFPPIIEIKVNGSVVSGANTRGLKKKPGTAPPSDLTKLTRTGANRLELTFINNSQPFVIRVQML
jgi:E3 SUMO-protein ligase PIAS1